MVHPKIQKKKHKVYWYCGQIVCSIEIKWLLLYNTLDLYKAYALIEIFLAPSLDVLFLPFEQTNLSTITKKKIHFSWIVFWNIISSWFEQVFAKPMKYGNIKS